MISARLMRNTASDRTSSAHILPKKSRKGWAKAAIPDCCWLSGEEIFIAWPSFVGLFTLGICSCHYRSSNARQSIGESVLACFLQGFRNGSRQRFESCGSQPQRVDYQKALDLLAITPLSG